MLFSFGQAALMTNRPIVRDANILSGRWRIDGTMIPVADVRNDYRFGHDGAGDYHFQDLSRAEITAALNFIFPAIRTTEVEMPYGVVSIECECGETTQETGTYWLEQPLECDWGR